MNLDHLAEVLWSLVAIMVGGLVWAIRLEGRVNLLSARMDDWMKERREVMQQVISHLDRLEKKMDQIRLRCAAFTHLHKMDLDLPRPSDEEPQ